jgi:hypothetical protein
MSGLRLWHLMLAVGVAGWTMALWRMGGSCCPIAVCSYICSCIFFGSAAARSRGWPWCVAFLLGFILGPFGLFLAWFRIIPEAEVISMRRRDGRPS